MIKRTISASVERFASRLPAGLWVLRLRSPFDRGLFPSAASVPLRQTVADELRRLLEGCAGASAVARVERSGR